MKAIEIFMFILIIILIYPGIQYLKNASEKPVKSSKGLPPKQFVGDSYYEPKPIWSVQDDQNTNFKYGGVSVLGSGKCTIYTYESSLITQKSDKNGMLNLLTNYSFVKPNVNNAINDFLDGNSHLSGKISSDNTDTENICFDADQVNVKYGTKKCNPDSVNECLDDNGFVLPKGSEFNYVQNCSSTPCPGQIGCISLNYHTNTSDNIDLETKCISIKGISVGSTTEEIYDLSFYREINIINSVSEVQKNGPYPIDLSLEVCDNTDARQKFKIIRYTYLDGTDPSQPGVSGFVLDDKGSYTSFIFRGLNSYLEVAENGSFQLRQIEQDETEGIKWILFPEVNLMRKTIPSLQRCAALASNFKSKTGLDGLVTEGNTGSFILGEAGLVDKGLVKVLGLRKNTLLNKSFNYLKDTIKNFGKTDQQRFYEQFKRAPWAEQSTEDAADSLKTILEKTATKTAEVAEKLDPDTVVLIVFTLIALLIPNPSYSDPPILSYGVAQNLRVGPTNFVNDITATSPGQFGEADITPIEHFCLKRKLPDYPPYFLISLTDGQKVQTQYINYKYEKAYSISASNVLNFGQSPADGLFIWKDEYNLPGVSFSTVWQDGDTTWAVMNTFSEAIKYDPSYFTIAGGVSNVIDFSLPNSGTVPANSGYVESQTGLIGQINLNSTKTIEQMNKNGRNQGNYLNISPQNVISSSGSPSVGTSATFNVTVGNTSPSKTQIISINLFDPGRNYSVGDQIQLSSSTIGGTGSDLGVCFGVSSLNTEVFTFKALSYYGKDSKGEDIYTLPLGQNSYTAKEDSDTVYPVLNNGFEINASYSNGKITFNKVYLQRNQESLPTGILSGGNSYKVGEPLYLAQYQGEGQGKLVQTGINYTPNSEENTRIESSSYKNFLTLTVTEVFSSNSILPNEPAPRKLYDKTENSNIPISLNYNFMDNSENIFAKSPQQIVYGGYSGSSYMTEFAKQFKGNLTSDNVYQYFLSPQYRESNGNLIAGLELSPINLKSLQVDTFKYKSYPVGSEIPPQPVVGGSSIILGRFIPYQTFLPASKNSDEDDFEIGYGVSEIYYNWNYSQIIPFGVQDPYVNKNFVQNPPKF